MPLPADEVYRPDDVTLARKVAFAVARSDLTEYGPRLDRLHLRAYLTACALVALSVGLYAWNQVTLVIAAENNPSYVMTRGMLDKDPNDAQGKLFSVPIPFVGLCSQYPAKEPPSIFLKKPPTVKQSVGGLVTSDREVSIANTAKYLDSYVLSKDDKAEQSNDAEASMLAASGLTVEFTDAVVPGSPKMGVKVQVLMNTKANVNALLDPPFFSLVTLMNRDSAGATTGKERSVKYEKLACSEAGGRNASAIDPRGTYIIRYHLVEHYAKDANHDKDSPLYTSFAIDDITKLGSEAVVTKDLKTALDKDDTYGAWTQKLQKAERDHLTKALEADPGRVSLLEIILAYEPTMQVERVGTQTSFTAQMAFGTISGVASFLNSAAIAVLTFLFTRLRKTQFKSAGEHVEGNL